MVETQELRERIAREMQELQTRYQEMQAALRQVEDRWHELLGQLALLDELDQQAGERTE